jgi:hypothetical protein
MKQIPTPQLIRIPDPALVSINSLAPGAIDPPKHSQETLWEEFLRLQQKPRTRHFPPRIPGQHQTTSDSSGVGVAAAPTQRGQSLSHDQSTHLSTEIFGRVRW